MIRRRGRCAVALVAVVVLLGALFESVAGAGTDVAPSSDGAGGESVLAVLNAGGGSFVQTADGYRLTLRAVERRAVWFSDRPARDAGSYSIEELAGVFFSGEDPPNAALEVYSGRGAGSVVVLEVSNPRYRSGRDRLVLDARTLAADEYQGTSLHSYAQRASGEVPARFGPAALFVDNIQTCAYDKSNVHDVETVDVPCDVASDIVDALLSYGPYDACNWNVTAPKLTADDYLFVCHQTVPAVSVELDEGAPDSGGRIYVDFD